jgi:tripartite-type tricarboxylate transporter receptor subunit TctC
MFARALAASILAASVLTIRPACGPASAQIYPSRPVTMLVGFPPGGVDDTIARMIQPALEKALGQTIVVENLGGAGGTIAAAKAAHSPADGYTILLHQDALAAGMTLYPDRSFDAVKDFVPIGLINTAPTTLAGRPDLPPKGGVVAAPLVQSSRLKAYAIVGKTPYAGLPQLKTFGQLGYKKLDIDFWHMLLAPAGTPQPIVDKLNAALRAALADAKVQKLFNDGGMATYPANEQTPEAAGKLLQVEIKLWGDVIRANHITGG